MANHMFQIKDLLAKFKQIEDPNHVRLGTANIINKVCGMDFLTGKSVEIKNNVAWLKTHPAIKQKVFFKKAECLSQIQAEFPSHNIIDLK